MMTTRPLKPPYLDEVTEDVAIPSFDSIELALKGFQRKVFNDLKLLTGGARKLVSNHPQQGGSVVRNMSETNGSNTVTISAPTDSSVMHRKDKEGNDSAVYPTNCRFCGGILRAIDKYREDRKLTLQCRRRKCMKFNGLTADPHVKEFLSKMAKPKAPQIDYGWYLSDPVRHSYRIFAGQGDSSDIELDRSNMDVRPIIRDGNIMLRVFGQTRLARLL